jgi:hypothetical protein
MDRDQLEEPDVDGRIRLRRREPSGSTKRKQFLD